jgi:hypothetical protein
MVTRVVRPNLLSMGVVSMMIVATLGAAYEMAAPARIVESSPNMVTIVGGGLAGKGRDMKITTEIKVNSSTTRCLPKEMTRGQRIKISTRGSNVSEIPICP